MFPSEDIELFKQVAPLHLEMSLVFSERLFLSGRGDLTYDREPT